MDSLRNIEVKTENLASSLFSRERFEHAAVVINDKLILVGGWGSSIRSGEIVNGLHKLEKNIHFVCCDSFMENYIHLWDDCAHENG